MDIQKIKNKGLYKDRERIIIGCQKYSKRNFLARKYNYSERDKKSVPPHLPLSLCLLIPYAF